MRHPLKPLVYILALVIFSGTLSAQEETKDINITLPQKEFEIKGLETELPFKEEGTNILLKPVREDTYTLKKAVKITNITVEKSTNVVSGTNQEIGKQVVIRALYGFNDKINTYTSIIGTSGNIEYLLNFELLKFGPISSLSLTNTIPNTEMQKHNINLEIGWKHSKNFNLKVNGSFLDRISGLMYNETYRTEKYRIAQLTLTPKFFYFPVYLSFPMFFSSSFLTLIDNKNYYHPTGEYLISAGGDIFFGEEAKNYILLEAGGESRWYNTTRQTNILFGNIWFEDGITFANNFVALGLGATFSTVYPTIFKMKFITDIPIISMNALDMAIRTEIGKEPLIFSYSIYKKSPGNIFTTFPEKPEDYWYGKLSFKFKKFLINNLSMSYELEYRYYLQKYYWDITDEGMYTVNIYTNWYAFISPIEIKYFLPNIFSVGMKFSYILCEGILPYLSRENLEFYITLQPLDILYIKSTLEMKGWSKSELGLDYMDIYPYAKLDIEGSIEIAKGFRMYLRLENVLNNLIWDRKGIYMEEGMNFGGGIELVL